MAVDYNWLFSYYNPCGSQCGTSTGSICTGRVYVNIFNRDNEAIDFNASPKIFDIFNQTDDKFRKFLTTHAERTHYHYGLVHCSELEIPDNPYGEDYVVEYWCECVSGSPDRDADKLVKIERITWAADRVHESRLDISQVTSIAELAGIQVFVQEKAGTDNVADSWGEYFSNADNFCCDTLANPISGYSGGSVGECLNSICEKIGSWPSSISGPQYVSHCAMSYDSEEEFLHLACWLELDGELQLDPLSYSVTMIDSDQNVIFTISGDEADLVDGMGVFFKQIADIALTPDETYFATVTINDASDDPHTSGVGPVAWD